MSPGRFTLPISFLLILAFYLFTLSPSVGWFDSGEFLSASFHLGIAHPPGEPLYLMAGKAASLIPIGSIPFRITLLSALFGAACVLLGLKIFLTFIPSTNPQIYIDTRSPILILTLFPLIFSALPAPFWFQCIRTELYTMSSLLVLLALYLLISSEERDLSFLLASFLSGLALSIHPASGISAMVPLLIAFIRRVLVGVQWIATSLYSILGVTSGILLPFIYLVVRGGLFQEVDFDAITTPAEFFDFATASIYMRTFEGIGVEGFFRNLNEFLRAFSIYLGTPFMVMALIGIAVLVFRGGAMGLFLLAALFTNMIPVLTQNLYSPANPDTWGYMGVSLILLPVAAGLTPALVLSLSLRAVSGGKTIPTLLMILLLALSLPPLRENAATPLHRSSRHAEIFGRSILEPLPAGAVYLCGGDSYFFPVLYLRSVEGMRRDVVPFNLYKTGGMSLAILKKNAPDIYLPDSPKPSDELFFPLAFSLLNSRYRDVLLSPITPDIMLRGRLVPSGYLLRFMDEGESISYKIVKEYLKAIPPLIERLEREATVARDPQTSLIISNNLRDSGSLLMENGFLRRAELVYAMAILANPSGKNPARHARYLIRERIKGEEKRGEREGPPPLFKLDGGGVPWMEEVLKLLKKEGEKEEMWEHILLGYQMVMEGDYSSSIFHWKMALQENPSSPLTLKGFEWLWRKGVR